MKILLFSLCALLVFAGDPASSRACKYCQMMRMDPESARLSGQVGGDGNFPLDSVTDKFQATTAAATLATPPPTASVATKASDLPTTVLRRPLPPPASKAPLVPDAGRKNVQPANVAAPGSAHWADAGLVGLAAAGGLFCWRTRRAAAPLP